MDDAVVRAFRMTRQLFPPVTDAGMVFRTPSRDEICERVVADVLGGAALVAVKGGRGVGKTSLIPILVDALEARGLVVIRSQATAQTPVATQRQIGAAFGLPTAATMKPDALFEALRAERGVQRIVLLFDNADTLSKTMFLYFGLLVELARTGLMNIGVVLLGGVAPWAGLEDEDVDTTRGAIVVRHVLFPFSDGEALAYLDQQFRQAGRSLRGMTTAAAAAELVAISGGMPAQVNALTEDALTRLFLARRKRITVGILRDAAAHGPAAVSRPVTEPRRVSSGTMAALLAGCVAAGSVGFIVLRAPPPDQGSPPISIAGADESPLPEMAVAAPARAPISPPQPFSPPIRAPNPTAQSSIAPPPGVLLPATVAAAPSQPDARVIASPTPSSQTVAIEPPPTALGLRTNARSVDQVWPRLPTLPAKSDLRVANHSVDQVWPRLPTLPAKSDLRVADHSVDQVWPRLSTLPARSDLRVAAQAIDQVWPRLPAPTELRVAAQSLDQVWPRQTMPPANFSVTLPAPAPTATAASLAASAASAPGLVLVAGKGDSIEALYAKIYRGLTPPPYAAVVAANHVPLRPGMLVIFPAPPGGWSQ